MNWHIVALCQFIHYLLSNSYKLITNVRSSLMAVNIHITLIELNALHTKRQTLFPELDALIHLLLAAEQWGWTKSRKATSLRRSEEGSAGWRRCPPCRRRCGTNTPGLAARAPHAAREAHTRPGEKQCCPNRRRRT